VFNRTKPEVREDDDSFYKRIRSEIEDHTGRTSGIKVFEHGDETTLDEQEREILAKLQAAHEEWHTNNPDSTETTGDDAYKSVKVRI
jgi:hypothetical protein